MGEDLEEFLFNDQPTTCPRCGNRTEIISNFYREGVFSEIHICLTEECQFQFIMEHKIEICSVIP